MKNRSSSTGPLGQAAGRKRQRSAAAGGAGPVDLRRSRRSDASLPKSCKRIHALSADLRTRRLPGPARLVAAARKPTRRPPPPWPARTRPGRSWPCSISSTAPKRFAQCATTISVQLDREESSSRRSGTPIVPKPPEGLQVSQLLPLLDDSDPAVAAEAGYLLALMGESRGLEPLLRYAQQQGKSDSPLQRLAYRAIAVLDDSNQIPLLKKDLRRSRANTRFPSSIGRSAS